MPNLTTIILLLTAVFLVLGFLLGFLRGFNRSVLRALLVIASLVLAFAFRGVVTNILMGLDIGGQTLKDSLVSAFSDGSLPASLQNLVMVLVEIMIGIVAFLAVFFVLCFITWLIVFPILKIFVRKGVHKRRILGAVVGVLQGFVMAFAFCAPVTGLVVQVDKISQLELEGKPVIEIPAEIGIPEYIESAPGKFYNSIGGWFFDMLSSGQTEDGKNLSVEDAVSIVVTVGDIANSVTEVENSMNVMTQEGATPQQRVDAMDSLGDSLIAIGESINDLSDDAKEIVNDVVSSIKDMAGGDLDPAIEEALNDFDIEQIDIAAAGEAMKGISSYIKKTSDEFEDQGEVVQADVDKIIGGLADNPLILSMVTQGEEVPTMIEIEDEDHKQLFTNAINETTLDADDKDALKKLFGIN